MSAEQDEQDCIDAAWAQELQLERQRRQSLVEKRAYIGTQDWLDASIAHINAMELKQAQLFNKVFDLVFGSKK